MHERVFLIKLGTGSRECAKGFGLSQEADCIQFYWVSAILPC